MVYWFRNHCYGRRYIWLRNQPKQCYVHVPGADGSASGKVLATDSAGNLSWTTVSDADSITATQADGMYVNVGGDTMTGKLLIDLTSGTDAMEVRQTLSGAIIHAEQKLTSSGAISADGNISINTDNGAADAVLTFGNDAAAETLTFSDSTNNFIFSDDVHATGNLSASGTLAVTSAATFGSTLDTIGNITTDANLTINEDNGADRRGTYLW